MTTIFEVINQQLAQSESISRLKMECVQIALAPLNSAQTFIEVNYRNSHKGLPASIVDALSQAMSVAVDELPMSMTLAAKTAVAERVKTLGALSARWTDEADARLQALVAEQLPHHAKALALRVGESMAQRLLTAVEKQARDVRHG